MPKNVRNFWVDGEIDGYTNNLTGGPRNKEGGIDITIKQRDNGAVTTALKIEGFANDKGELSLRVKDKDDNLVFENDTKR